MAKVLTVFAHAVLISGPEPLLVDRAVAERIAAARSQDAEVEVSETDAGRLDRGALAQISSPSLFSTYRLAVIRDLGSLVSDLHQDLVELATAPDDDLGLVLVHPGGNKGKGLLTALKKARVETVDCPTPKPWELPRFVTAEVKRQRASIDTETAQAIIDSVGHDLRALSSAIAQLAADSADKQISRAMVQRYFGGRAEVTSFAVADAAVAGHSGPAMEQLQIGRAHV